LPPDRRGRRQDGKLRKLLFDLRDLDELIEVWKGQQRLCGTVEVGFLA
jgi:hypothetical protein